MCGITRSGDNVQFAALECVNAMHPQPLPDRMTAFGIAGGGGSGIKRLFMTHPPLEERIAALRAAQ